MVAVILPSKTSWKDIPIEVNKIGVEAPNPIVVSLNLTLTLNLSLKSDWFIEKQQGC